MTPWTAAHQASLSFTITWSLLRLMSIESMMPSNHLILCHSLLLLPSVFPSIRVFSNVLALHTRWPKCWSFSFSISPSSEYSGLISFRIDCFDLAVRIDWFDLLQSKKLSRVFSSTTIRRHQILWCLAFFIVHLSHQYMTCGKTIALIIWTFVGKVMSLLFNILFRFVIDDSLQPHEP